MLQVFDLARPDQRPDKVLPALWENIKVGQHCGASNCRGSILVAARSRQSSGRRWCTEMHVPYPTSACTMGISRPVKRRASDQRHSYAAVCASLWQVIISSLHAIALARYVARHNPEVHHLHSHCTGGDGTIAWVLGVIKSLGKWL